MVMTASERVKKSRLKNDCITIRPALEKGKEIRAAAEKADQPLTVYIMQAIESRLQSEKE
jgi:hypothetical protein